MIDDALRYMADAARDERLFYLVVIDATDSTSPSKTLWTEAFYGNVAACLAPGGVAVDSDILTFGSGGATLSRDPCELGIFDLMRSKRFFGRVECYHSIVPLYPGGYFAFFLYSKDAHSYRKPTRDLSFRYYNARIHEGAFALPTWWRALMER